MSIKNLFSNQPKTVKSTNSSSSGIESNDYSLIFEERNEEFIPFIDFSSASNFAKFGSAEEYYKNSIERIHDDYPYDGSLKEKIQFDLSSSYLDKYILRERYPKTNGYINLSYNGWGSQTSTADGFGLSDSNEFIFIRGGVHTYDETSKLSRVFDKSIKYDVANNRTSGLKVNPLDGITVEFWLKKESFATAKTNKEVVLDLWNGQLSSSSNYGRFTLALSGTTSGANPFIITMQSGTSGFYEQSLGTSTVTTSSLSDWHHYAFSFVSESSGIMSRLYVDGDLNESSSLGSTGLNEIGGLTNGYIGALQTSPSGSSAAQFSGKLSASLDEFRFWKKRRSSEEIYNNWYQHIGGGTNTDKANVYLGFYYKFNEGVVGDDTTDSKILDYSGRLVNGSWTGYSSGARSTSSAFVESGLLLSEEKDPIIYSSHPEVSSLKTTLMAQGKEHDNENNGMLYHKVPGWIQAEDFKTGFATKNLYQIISSYFDNLYQQITFLPHLKNKTYVSSSYKPLPFADRLLEDKGMYVANLFGNASVLEYFSNRDKNKVQFEEKIHDLKNQIYTNIYNNLENIYKEKGTESGIRNMLRCFGIDDELVKLNIYTDKGTHYFSDAFKNTNVKKKFIDFNRGTNLNATIFQTSSVNHSLTYVSGSKTDKKEQYNALTSEVSIILPKKRKFLDPEYYDSNFITSSIFGVHQATSSANDYTWDATNLSNFQVFVVKDEENSPSAKFVLKDYNSNIFLETPFYKEVYNNESWNLAVRIKPEDYPIAGNVVTSSNRNYKLEFYGVSHAFDTVKQEFILSASLNYATGSSYLSNPKRFYVGSHRENFTGSVLQKCDIEIGRFNVWYDYLSNSTIKLHNKDITSKGTEKSFKPSTIFGKDLEQIQVPSNELLTIDWDFETVTSSDSSGNFIVEDASSGSVDSRYGWMDNIIRREHRAKGFGFPASNSATVKNTIVNCSKKELPEISYSSDRVRIMDNQNMFFIEDEDVSDNFYALEKSMYQTISEEMMKTLSTAQVMSNLMGEAVDRYRIEYKKLNHVRRVFFEDVEEDPDFDKFTEYFKWIDSSVSYMISQLFPVSVRSSKGISEIIESHLFERNKYQNKFPIISTHDSTEGRVVGVGQAKYSWKFGHAPLSGDDNDNCLWQKERAERLDITERETIKNILGNRNNSQSTILAGKDRSSYSGSTFATRRFTKTVQLNSVITQTLHGGINYNLQKNRNYLWSAVNRHSRLNSLGIPVNVMIVGAGPGQGIELPKECNDVEKPNKKSKFNSTVFIGKEAAGGAGGTFSPINDSSSYSFSLKGHQKLPFNLFSGNVNSGYNSEIVSGYRSDAILTNLHSDTTDFSNDVPLQGPFTQQWVGGHQSRHIDLNRFDENLIDGETLTSPPNNLQNLYTRPEAWRLVVVEQGGSSDGALGLVEPQYGITGISGHPNSGNYPDAAKKSATLFRGLRAKSPVNIANIQTLTSSVNHGNYQENYQVISSFNKNNNNLFFRKNNSYSFLPDKIGTNLPTTTNAMTLIGQSPLTVGNVFGTYNNNRQPNQAAVPAYAGTKASGSLSVFGVDMAGKASSDGDSWRVAGSHSTYGTNYGFEVDTNSSATYFSVAPTSSNAVFWDAIESRLQQKFTVVTSSTAATFGEAWSATVAEQSIANTGSSNNILIDVQEFTLSMWLNMATSSFGACTLWQETSTTGSSAANRFSRRLFFDSTPSLSFETHYDDGGTNRSRFWLWSKADVYDSFSGSMAHFVIRHDGNPTNSPTLYINNSLISTSHASAWTHGVLTPKSSDNELHLLSDSNTSANTHFVGVSDDVSFWTGSMTNSQVSELYNLGRILDLKTHSQYSNLLFWYDFEDEPTAGSSIPSWDDNIVLKTHYVGAASNYYSLVTSSVPTQFSYATFQLTASSVGAGFNVTPTVAGSSIFSATAIAGGTDAVAGVEESKNSVNRITGSTTRAIITSRFSAPGSIDTLSYGYLDAYSQEFSVHNNLNYRNLSVRGAAVRVSSSLDGTDFYNFGGSGEANTIRVNDHRQNRDSYKSLLSRHSGKFGIDSRYGSELGSEPLEQDNPDPSFYKQQRNESRRPADTSTIARPELKVRHDNMFVNSPIPRSDFQYKWVTSSLGSNYSITGGKQRMYGYAHPTGILSSSVVIDGDSGFVPAISFPTASEIFGV